LVSIIAMVQMNRKAKLVSHFEVYCRFFCNKLKCNEVFATAPFVILVVLRVAFGRGVGSLSQLTRRPLKKKKIGVGFAHKL
jgi:hypothetical protein